MTDQLENTESTQNTEAKVSVQMSSLESLSTVDLQLFDPQMLTDMPEGDFIDDGDVQRPPFDMELITKYPHSGRKLPVHVTSFGIHASAVEAGEKLPQNGQTVHISPHGLEFKTSQKFTEGTLIKIHISLPDYWARKQKFVEYTRIDCPENFHLLARVLKTEDLGKRGKKKLVTAQTLVIDQVDEQVLKSFLQDE